MSEVLKQLYDKLLNSISVDEVREIYPDKSSWNLVFKTLHRYCKVEQRGKDKKKYYTLKQVPAIEFNPLNKEMIDNGIINETFLKIASLDEKYIGFYMNLHNASLSSKQYVLIIEIIIKSLCFPDQLNIFKYPNGLWEFLFIKQCYEYLDEFNHNHGIKFQFDETKLRIYFRVSIQILKDIIEQNRFK